MRAEQLLEELAGFEGKSYKFCWTGRTTRIGFFKPQHAEERQLTAPVRDGQLVVGSWGPSYYFVDLRDSGVFEWDPDLNERGEPTPQLRKVAPSLSWIGSNAELVFLGRDRPMQSFARNATESEVADWIAKGPEPQLLREAAEEFVELGRPEQLKLILEQGCDTSRLVSMAGRTPHVNILRLLVEEYGLSIAPALKWRNILAPPEMKAFLETAAE